MRCGRFRRHAGKSLDSELRPREVAALREHLDGCAACRAHLAELEAVQSHLSTLSIPNAPQGLTASILAAARSVRAAGPGRRRVLRPAWLLWPAGAAASAAALLLGHLAGATLETPVDAEPTRSVETRALAVELSLEEPFSLLPDAEETLVLLAFDDHEAIP